MALQKQLIKETCLCIACILICLSSAPLHAQQLLIRQANIVDVSRGVIENQMDILIKNGRVVKIARRIKVNSSTRIYDSRGKFAIPGLWDMHVHIRKPEEMAFNLLLYNGITGVRDLHNPFRGSHPARWKDSIAALTMPLPRLVAVAGRILDGPGDSRGLGFDEVDSEDEARKAVLNRKETGADFVKVYSNLNRNTYISICDEARKNQLPIHGHLPYSVTLSDALNAGQSCFEHLETFHVPCSPLSSQLNDMLLQTQTYNAGFWNGFFRMVVSNYSRDHVVEVAKMLAKYGAAICPTLKESQMYYLRNDVYSRTPSIVSYAPKEIDRWYRGEKIPPPRNQEDSMMFARVFELELEMLKILHQNGVLILAGTDSSPIRYNIPGYGLHDELQFYVTAGLTTLQALQTATIIPAKFLGKQEEFGSIEEGKIADIVLLDANPLEHIQNLRRINAVFLNGVLMDKSYLEQLLENAIKIANSGRP